VIIIPITCQPKEIISVPTSSVSAWDVVFLNDLVFVLLGLYWKRSYKKLIIVKMEVT